MEINVNTLYNYYNDLSKVMNNIPEDYNVLNIKDFLVKLSDYIDAYNRFITYNISNGFITISNERKYFLNRYTEATMALTALFEDFKKCATNKDVALSLRTMRCILRTLLDYADTVSPYVKINDSK